VAAVVCATDAIYMTSGRCQSVMVSGCLWPAACWVRLKAWTAARRKSSNKAVRLLQHDLCRPPWWVLSWLKKDAVHFLGIQLCHINMLFRST